MANLSVKFNNKEFLLSCDDGQEDHLQELANSLNERFDNLKSTMEKAHEPILSLDVPIIEWHVKSTTKAQQGLYEYDAVSRLRDSQLGDKKVNDIANYIKKGKLW